jgi:DNA-binding beta-propeller fold protein YncE
LLVVACGTDEIIPDRPDAGRGTVADAGPTPADAAPNSTTYALGTDYETAGVLSRVRVPSLTVTPNLVAGVASSDPVLRAFGDRLYVVNRFGADNVTIVDRATEQLVAQLSTGAGSNPQDVAVKGDLLYVAALGVGAVLVLDAGDPAAAPARIDLSAYDVDGNPDAGSVWLVGDRLFVTLSLFDAGFDSRGGKVVVIDTTTNAIEADFDLVHANPFSLLTPTPVDGALGGDLLVTTTDFAGTGCIERIATEAPGSHGCLIEESALGGYASRLGASSDRVIAAVNTSFTAAALHAVSAAGELSAAMTADTAKPTDVAVCPTGEVVVADGNAGGLRVFDAAGAELSTAALDLGLPPVFANGLVCL